MDTLQPKVKEKTSLWNKKGNKMCRTKLQNEIHERKKVQKKYFQDKKFKGDRDLSDK